MGAFRSNTYWESWLAASGPQGAVPINSRAVDLFDADSQRRVQPFHRPFRLILNGEELGTVQKAFVEEDAFQCGYCTSGQVMAAEGLLRANPSPSFDEIRGGMSGNLCRCGAYPHIVNAVTTAADKKKGGR